MRPYIKNNRKNKFSAKKTKIDGITFDSKKEARRYIELRTLNQAGEIKNLKVHYRYPLAVNGVKITTYEADFQYEQQGQLVVEDVKSAPTKRLPAYQMKKKLMKALYKIDIREV